VRRDTGCHNTRGDGGAFDKLPEKGETVLKLDERTLKDFESINQLPHPKPQVLSLSSKFDLGPTTIVNREDLRIRGENTRFGNMYTQPREPKKERNTFKAFQNGAKNGRGNSEVISKGKVFVKGTIKVGKFVQKHVETESKNEGGERAALFHTPGDANAGFGVSREYRGTNHAV
jgi:hypothetical protein